jgi:hypothetical protein
LLGYYLAVPYRGAGKANQRAVATLFRDRKASAMHPSSTLFFFFFVFFAGSAAIIRAC